MPVPPKMCIAPRDERPRDEGRVEVNEEGMSLDISDDEEGTRTPELTNKAPRALLAVADERFAQEEAQRIAQALDALQSPEGRRIRDGWVPSVIG